jgi:uncharacterized protein
VPELAPYQAALLLLAVGGVAGLYSAVGHGGATGYLAVATLLGLAPTVARPGALWMNCLVASIAFWRFRRAGWFDWGTFGPVAAASVPCAWLGSRLHLDGYGYAIALGSTLAGAGWFLGWGRRAPGPEALKRVAWPLAMLAGAGLGLLAGLTGIGGGVFLTPLLIFLRWTPPKVAAGVSALFIVVNSIAGLVGLGHRALLWHPVFFGALALGLVGALLGSQCGVNRWQTATFRRVLAGVLWIAAGKLFLSGT